MRHRKHYLFLLLFFCLLFSSTKAEQGLYAPAAFHLLRDTLPDNDSTAGQLIFTKVDIEASYPGGENAWRRFLEQNLDPAIPVTKKAPADAYTVIIQFIVDKQGYVSDIIPLTRHGYGMEEEVMRLLKKSPRWRPASQNGRTVKAYRKQPVTFMIEEEKKRKKGELKSYRKNLCYGYLFYYPVY